MRGRTTVRLFRGGQREIPCLQPRGVGQVCVRVLQASRISFCLRLIFLFPIIFLRISLKLELNTKSQKLLLKIYLKLFSILDTYINK